MSGTGQPDYQGAAATFNPSGDYLAATQNLTAAQQIAAQVLAGKQIAAGNPGQAVNTLYGSGNLAAAQQENQTSQGIIGATAAANRNYAGAAQAAGAAGDQAGVQSAQGAQYQQYQILGNLVGKALPTLTAAYQQGGSGALTHSVSLLTQEYQAAGLMSPQQSSLYMQQAANDPQGFLTSAGNFVKQTQYQKVGDGTLLGTNALGDPVSLVNAQNTQVLPQQGGGSKLDVIPASVVPVGQGGGPTSPQASNTVLPTLPAGTNLTPGAVAAQESSSNPNTGKSVNGAVGQFQILPGTFAQYAKPGENINNPADNAAVSQRILTDYSQRWPGDAARQAVAYFSGPANVAPAGSSTPWLVNYKDGTGTPVSTYTAQMLSRLLPTGTAQNGSSDAAQAAPTAQSAPGAPGGVQTLDNTNNGQPLYRSALPSELPPGAASAQVNSATGQLSNIISKADVDNLTPQATKQLGEQYWLTGVMPDIGRGDAASLTKQNILNYAAQKSAALGITGIDDASRHNVVQSAQKQLSTMLGQQAQIQASENNANDSAHQILTLLPKAAATYGFSTLNELQQAAKRYTQDPNLAKLDEALTDFNGDFAKTQFSNANGSGGSGGVSDREDIKDLFNADDSVPVLQAKLQQAQIAMRFRSGEFGNAIDRLNMIATTGMVPQDPQAATLAGGSNPGGQPVQAAPAATAPNPQQQGAQAQPTMQDLAYLQAHPDPQHQAAFDTYFGAGASKAALGRSSNVRFRSSCLGARGSDLAASRHGWCGAILGTRCRSPREQQHARAAPGINRRAVRRSRQRPSRTGRICWRSNGTDAARDNDGGRSATALSGGPTLRAGGGSAWHAERHCR